MRIRTPARPRRLSSTSRRSRTTAKTPTSGDSILTGARFPSISRCSTAERSSGGDSREAGERHRDFFFRVLLILELAGGVVDVRLHVEVAVTAEVEEDGLRHSLLAAADGL